MGNTNDGTTYSAVVDENLLGLTTVEQINEAEQKGVLEAQDYILDLDEHIRIDSELIKKIHHKAFGEIYDWAGRYRTEKVVVGGYTPPEFYKVSELMEQYVGNIQFRIERIKDEEDFIDLLAYAHHEILHIHPFKNGNGRTSRFITNIIAISQGYEFVEVYVRTGNGRETYLEAVRAGDNKDYSLLIALIKQGLKKLN